MLAFDIETDCSSYPVKAGTANKRVGNQAPDQLHQNPTPSRTDGSSNPNTISHKSINLRNNVSHELLYIKSYTSCFNFPCRHCVGVLAWKWGLTPATQSREFKFQCWIQSPELLRSSYRHFWGYRWDIGNAYSNIRTRVPLSSGHDEVIAAIFATRCVCITFTLTIYRVLI
jgi:hypothetical protein